MSEQPVITSADIFKAREKRSLAANDFAAKKSAENTKLKEELIQEYKKRLPVLLQELEQSLSKQMHRMIENPSCDKMDQSAAYAQFQETDEEKHNKALELKIENWPEVKSFVSYLCEKYQITQIELRSYSYKKTINLVRRFDVGFIFKFSLPNA